MDPTPQLHRSPFHRNTRLKAWERSPGSKPLEPLPVPLFLRKLADMHKRSVSNETCITFVKQYLDEHLAFALDALARSTMEFEMDARLSQLEALAARAGVRPALDTALSDYKKVFATMLREHGAE